MIEERTEENNYFLQAIRKHIVLIVLITIATAVITGILNFYVIKPVYQANCSVIVGKQNGEQITESEVLMYQGLIKTYSELGKSRKVAENASEKLNFKILPDELMANMKITPESGTQIIRISYESLNPKDAADTVNALVDAFAEECKILLPAGQANIIDKALVSNIPAKPNKIVNITLGFLFGLMGAISLSFLIEYSDHRIKTEKDLKKYLEIPYMGIIPKYAKLLDLIVVKEPKSSVTEAYKKIRTNILFSLQNKGLKTLLITSPNPHDGKTVMATNLALTIAEIGKKTLLLDCDFRSPAIKRHFKIQNEEGITDFISGSIKLEQIINVVNSNFDVIIAGSNTQNPTEILASDKMKLLINEMEKIYDYIIIDSSPLMPVTDALILVAEEVGVLLVLNAAESNIDTCKKSKELLLKVDANLLGAVLNKVDKKLFSGSEYNYYYKGETKGKTTLDEKNKKRNVNGNLSQAR